MPDVTISGSPYKSYITVAEADTYLAADAQYYEDWDLLDVSAKARAVVSATRYMQELSWVADPDVDAAAQEVKDVCCILAAMVAQDPALLDGASPASNIKRAKAGSAEVEFFSPQGGARLPSRLSRMLEGLLSTASSGGLGVGRAYSGGHGVARCPDSCENGLNGPFS